MADTLAIIATAIRLTVDVTKALYYFTLLLFVQLFRAIVFVLSPFWAVTSFVLLPLTHLVQAALSIILFPFRWRLFEKLEVCTTLNRHVNHLFTHTDNLHLPRHRRPRRHPRRRRPPPLFRLHYLRPPHRCSFRDTARANKNKVTQDGH